jgi:hypothetical protein
MRPLGHRAILKRLLRSPMGLTSVKEMTAESTGLVKDIQLIRVLSTSSESSEVSGSSPSSRWHHLADIVAVRFH